MRRWFWLLALLCFCDKSHQPDLKQWDRFASVYQEYLTTLTSDTSRQELHEHYLRSILRRHGLSRQAFDSLAVSLQTQPQLFDQLLIQINANLQKEAAAKKSAK